MSSTLPVPLLRFQYYQAAQDYLRHLPPEHFMESPPHAKQREITVESLALLRGARPDVHYFNELLVQYPFGPEDEIHQVVPDNMVIISTEPIEVGNSFDVPLQVARPFLMLEYVSPSNKRKDYVDNMQKYDRELKVPYYLVFDPEILDLRLYHRGARKFRLVKANVKGRLAIAELDLEVAVHEDWVRFWHLGQLLPLPLELQQELNEARHELQESREQTRQAKEQARQAQDQAKLAQDQVRQAEENAKQAQDQAKQAQDQAKQAQDQAKQAQDQAKQAQDQAKQAQERELRYLEILRQHGIDPGS